MGGQNRHWTDSPPELLHRNSKKIKNHGKRARINGLNGHNGLVKLNVFIRLNR